MYDGACYENRYSGLNDIDGLYRVIGNNMMIYILLIRTESN
jgi:hypothetical protein